MRDIRLIFAAVPSDWIKEIKEVRLANSLEWHAHTFFSRYDGCLTIYSRNRMRQQALNAVLSELVAIAQGKDRGLHHRPKAVQDQLEKIAAPFLEQLLPLITPPPGPKGYVSMEGFKELRFPFVPNDIQ